MTWFQIVGLSASIVALLASCIALGMAVGWREGRKFEREEAESRRRALFARSP